MCTQRLDLNAAMSLRLHKKTSVEETSPKIKRKRIRQKMSCFGDPVRESATSSGSAPTRVLLPTSQNAHLAGRGGGDNAIVANKLQVALRSEVSLEMSHCSTMVSGQQEEDAFGFPCSMCPFRRLPDPDSLMRHIESSHNPKNMFTCSGAKQRRLVLALYDSDMLAGCEEAMGLLCRSACIMRSTIKPGLSPKINNINKLVRLVLTETGPQYHNAVTVGRDVPVRRVSNLFYTKGFANLLFREMMMTKGRLEEALTRMQLEFSLQGCEIGSLMPNHSRVTWRLVQDLISAKPILSMRTELLSQLEENGEFETLSIDGTVKIAM